MYYDFHVYIYIYVCDICVWKGKACVCLCLEAGTVVSWVAAPVAAGRDRGLTFSSGARARTKQTNQTILKPRRYLFCLHDNSDGSACRVFALMFSRRRCRSRQVISNLFYYILRKCVCMYVSIDKMLHIECKSSAIYFWCFLLTRV